MYDIINVGSLNVDYVYHVDHITEEGETQPAESLQIFCGGKGLNQSVAASRAGARAAHVGAIGSDKEGAKLAAMLESEGVDTTHIVRTEGTTGHALIQVAQNGQNSIVIHGGANRELSAAHLSRALQGGARVVLTQNETNCTAELFELVHATSATMIYNPAPMTDATFEYPLEYVDILIVNEIEGLRCAGLHDEAQHAHNGQKAQKKRDAQKEQDAGAYGDAIVSAILARYPHAAVVLTMEAKGAYYGSGGIRHYCPAQRVEAVDTTAAGDTFIGFFIAMMLKGYPMEEVLDIACRAAALSVTRHGATTSIPTLDEIGSLPPLR